MFIFYVSAAVAKRRWKTLHDGLREALKRQKTTSGQAAKNVKPYKYQTIMEFVVPQMTNRSRETNVAGTSTVLNPSDSEEFADDPEVAAGAASETPNENQAEGDSERDEESQVSGKRRRGEGNVSDRVIQFLTEQREVREKNAEERRVRRQQIKGAENDFFFEFFRSMYNTTRVLPLVSQLKIKIIVFNAVAEEEERGICESRQSFDSWTPQFYANTSTSASYVTVHLLRLIQIVQLQCLQVMTTLMPHLTWKTLQDQLFLHHAVSQIPNF